MVKPWLGAGWLSSIVNSTELVLFSAISLLTVTTRIRRLPKAAMSASTKVLLFLRVVSNSCSTSADVFLP